MFASVLAIRQTKNPAAGRAWSRGRWSLQCKFWNTLLGGCYNNYIRVGGDTYDPRFCEQIMEMRPDWFMNRSDIANQKKRHLLKLAKSGQPRPNHKHPLGNVLCMYTNPKKQDVYDPKFNQQIRSLRPDWFVGQSEIAAQKKQKLLEMARSGYPKPIIRKHPLGGVLHEYTNRKKNVYDPEFDKQIRALRPDWFVSRSELANQKKEQLLEMARNGEPRPHSRNHPLGSAFHNYLKDGDSKFVRELKRLRPDWFGGKDA